MTQRPQRIRQNRLWARLSFALRLPVQVRMDNPIGMWWAPHTGRCIDLPGAGHGRPRKANTIAELDRAVQSHEPRPIPGNTVLSGSASKTSEADVTCHVEDLAAEATKSVILVPSSRDWKGDRSGRRTAEHCGSTISRYQTDARSAATSYDHGVWRPGVYRSSQ